MKRPALLMTILLLLSLTAIFARALPRYRQYQQRRGLEQARRFLATGNFGKASVSARRVLQINQRNLDACRFMAELTERLRSLTAIDWRRRMIEIEPSVENHLALAACALQLERPPYTIARGALMELGADVERVPRFHVLSAELAIKSNDLIGALEHFRKAVRLDPDNVLYQFNTSVLELQSTNVSVAETAREHLEQACNNPSLAVLAFRSLVVDGLKRNDLIGAERFSNKLLSLPAATFDDRLLHLTILERRTKNGGEPQSAERLTKELQSAQACAGSNGLQVYELCEWMGSHGYLDAALAWVSTLQPEFRKIQPVPLAEANLYLRQQNWSKLQEFLSRQSWGELEFLRLAMLARGDWGAEHNAMGDARWESSLRAGSDRLGALMLLLGLANDWGREPDDVLWQINRRFPREQWALRQLEQQYVATGDTAGLNKVYAQEIEDKGSANLTNRNDFVVTSLLLGKNLPQAHSMAGHLYREHPEDVIVSSTYAYSLHLLGRSREGAAILARFSESDLQQPAIALYYGILLTATGQRSQASSYLSIAERVRLSPEEKRLLDMAKAECGGK